jgi:2-C-methyl-D-erythritol 4-phosphate cytidylyltransferase
MIKEYAIIVAGGTGSRIHSEYPKQFLILNKVPVLYHSIKAFHDYSNNIEIIIAMNPDYIDLWKTLCKKYDLNLSHKITKGGNTRFHSVQNALNFIKSEKGNVAIHDAARPIITKGFIKDCYDAVKLKKAIIPCIDIYESLRKTEGNISKPIDRNKVKIVQTPQCFNLSIIKKAYKQKYSTEFTDDATVYEKSEQKKVSLIKGLNNNLKITTDSDIELADFLLKKQVNTHLH